MVQNSSVVICVVAITSYLGVFPEDDDDTGSGPEVPLETKATTKLAVTVIVIAFSALAKLASSGTVIIMQRDWIVVIANGSNDKLASESRLVRGTIDRDRLSLIYQIPVTEKSVLMLIYNLINLIDQ